MNEFDYIWKSYDLFNDFNEYETFLDFLPKTIYSSYDIYSSCRITICFLKNNNTVIPKVAILSDAKSNITKITGLNELNILDSDILSLLENRIKRYKNGLGYLIKVYSQQKYNLLLKKISTNEELSKDDIKYLYGTECYFKLKSVSQDYLDKMIENRDIRKDLATAYNIKESEVALNEDELNKNSIINYGDINVIGKDHVNYPNLKIMIGDFIAGTLTTSRGLGSLRTINGNAKFESLKSAKYLSKLENIDKTAHFENLKHSKGLKNLRRIGKDAHFESLIEGKRLKKLTLIEGKAFFNNLDYHEQLPKTIIKNNGKQADRLVSILNDEVTLDVLYNENYETISKRVRERDSFYTNFAKKLTR